MATLPRFLNAIRPSDALAFRTMQLALELDHPAYDCVYLAYAEETTQVLLTSDARLLNHLQNTPHAYLVHAVSALP